MTSKVIARPFWPYLELRQYRSVLWQLVRQQLILRYRRTFLGYFWTLLNPLLIMGVTSVVFSTLFKQDLKSYVIFLFAGMAPWTYFNNTVVQSSTAFLSNEGLLKKIYLPKLLFPVATSLSLLIDSFLSTVSLFLIVLFIGAKITPALLFLPVAYLLLFLFAIGIALCTSVLTVYFRDMNYLLGIVLQAWFFLTPIMYKSEAISGVVKQIIALNPMTPFVELFRFPIYLGRLPAESIILSAGVFAIGSLLFGLVIFRWRENDLMFRL
jgi:ABC-type polysaccharide/polyol phosphate export permease